MADSVKQKVNRNGDRRGMSLVSQANLQRKGRPCKDKTLLEVIRQRLPEVCEYDHKSRTWLEALADVELRMALTDVSARRDLFDRLLGKPALSIAVGGEDGGPVRVEYVKVNQV